MGSLVASYHAYEDLLDKTTKGQPEPLLPYPHYLQPVLWIRFKVGSVFRSYVTLWIRISDKDLDRSHKFTIQSLN